MEDNEKTASYRKKFPCITAVLPDTDLQQQCNRQNLDSFASYDPSMVFPKIR
jgi:adenine phosphoribosyltransferase